MKLLVLLCAAAAIGTLASAQNLQPLSRNNDGLLAQVNGNCVTLPEALLAFVNETSVRQPGHRSEIAIVYDDVTTCVETLCLETLVELLRLSEWTRSILLTPLNELVVHSIEDRHRLYRKRAFYRADVQMAWTRPEDAWAMKQRLVELDLVTINTHWLFLSAPNEQEKWRGAPSEAEIELMVVEIGSGGSCILRERVMGEASAAGDVAASGMLGAPLRILYRGSMPHYTGRAVRSYVKKVREQQQSNATTAVETADARRQRDSEELEAGAFFVLSYRLLAERVNYRATMVTSRGGWGRRLPDYTWDGVIGQLLERKGRVVFAGLIVTPKLLNETRVLMSPLRKPLDLLIYCSDDGFLNTIFEWIPARNCAILIIVATLVGVALDCGETISATTSQSTFATAPNGRRALSYTSRIYSATLGQTYLSVKQVHSILILGAWMLGIGFFGAAIKSELLPRLLVRSSCMPSRTPRAMLNRGYLPLVKEGTILDTFREHSAEMRTLANRALAPSRDVYRDLDERVPSQKGVFESVRKRRQALYFIEHYMKTSRWAMLQHRTAANAYRLEIDSCNLRAGVKDVFKDQEGSTYAAFRLGDPLADVFERELTILQQFGLVDGIYRKAELLHQMSTARQRRIRSMANHCEREALAKVRKKSPLVFGQVAFAAQTLGAGLLLALVAMMGEMLLAFVRPRKSIAPQALARLVDGESVDGHWPENGGR